MAETAIPRDADKYLDVPEIGLTKAEKAVVKKFVEDNRRVQGQADDDLRMAGLKMVSRGLELRIKEQGGYWKSFRLFTNEPRHLIQAIEPSCSDVIMAQRLGFLGVDMALAGYEDCMISQWLTEYVAVPLELVVLGRKRIPPQGIFWRSVLASTGR